MELAIIGDERHTSRARSSPTRMPWPQSTFSIRPLELDVPIENLRLRARRNGRWAVGSLKFVLI